MLIHSVTPRHFLSETQPYPEMTYKPFGCSYLEGLDTPQGFQLLRLHSTDPALYLKNEYTPGSLMKK